MDLEVEVELEGSASDDHFLSGIQVMVRYLQWDQHAHSKGKIYITSVAEVRKGQLLVQFLLIFLKI